MTTDQYNITAQKRTLLGKKVKQLRAKGLIPANIFGKVDQSLSISVDSKAFRKIYQEAGETALIYLSLDNEKTARPTLIDDVEYHPISGACLHVAFRQVDLKEKITATVAVELTGELTIDEASVNQMIQEVEVEALPTDLPESFQIDLSQFTQIGQEFTIQNLHIDRSKVEIIGAESEDVILMIQEVQEMAEEVAEVAPAEGDQATTEQAAPAEGADAQTTPDQDKAGADAGQAADKKE